MIDRESNGWQVRTAGGVVLADNGAWHAFTVSTTTLFTKQAPANGATGLGSTVTFTWTAVAGESYRVCWDTTNNGGCNATWVEAGSATTRTVTGLAPGTYSWPFDLVDSPALRVTLSERQ